MKMLITLEQRGIFGSNFVYLYKCILLCPAAGGQNGDETSRSIILDGRSLLVKMLITFEAHGIFSSNFACLYSLHESPLTLSRHWYAKQRQGFTEHQFGRSCLVSRNAHNS